MTGDRAPMPSMFGRETSQNKACSNQKYQNKGHLSSRYVFVCEYNHLFAVFDLYIYIYILDP